MANIQSKNIVHLNQIKLRRTHKISGNNTILKLEKKKKKKVTQNIFKKAIILATNKLEKFKEDDSDIITRAIAETIVKIFELRLEALTGNNFLKRFVIQIWKKIAQKCL